MPPDNIENNDWPDAHRRLAKALGVLGAGIAAVTFWNIYDTVTAVAQPYLGAHRDWQPVAAGEIAFLFLFGVGVLLDWRRAPGGALRPLGMGLLMTGSVILNVWSARGKTADLIIHLMIVGAFFIVMLVGKAAIRALKGGRVKADRVGFLEWVAHPIHSFRLQRWMITWGETSRKAAHADYMRLLFATAIAQADPRVGKKPRWRRNLPITLRYQLSLGQLPKFPDETWQTDLARHVRDELNAVQMSVEPSVERAVELSVGDHVSTDVGESVERPAERTVERRPRRSVERTPDYDKKPSPAACKKMTADALAPYVEAWIKQGNPVAIKRVSDAFRIGDRKAKSALVAAGLWGDDAPVIDMVGVANARS